MECDAAVHAVSGRCRVHELHVAMQGALLHSLFLGSDCAVISLPSHRWKRLATRNTVASMECKRHVGNSWMLKLQPELKEKLMKLKR